MWAYLGQKNPTQNPQVIQSYELFACIFVNTILYQYSSLLFLYI